MQDASPTTSLFDIVLGEPIEHSAQDVFLMGGLFDAVAFVGVDDHLRFDASGRECSVKPAVHRQPAAAVVARFRNASPSNNPTA